MDLESTYLIIGVFVIVAAIFLVMDYLFKNKSYEEVVAAQRQQTNALFASQNKPKIKDKKQKKAIKKQVKEKKNSTSKDSTAESAAESDVPDKQPMEHHHHPDHSKHHVEFKEPTVIDEPPKDTGKRKSKDMVIHHSILVNRDSSAENIRADTEAPLANHFEEMHPKDEVELHHIHPKEGMLEKKRKQSLDQEVMQVLKNNKKSGKQQLQVQQEAPVKNEEVAVEQIIEPVVVQSNGVSAVPPAKEKKKKKNDANALVQIASDKHGVNLSSLLPMVRKAEMSRVEVQILIDMLLNKQQDAPVVDDWSEGKGDPVQKLKKQLAEKEKQLFELQESLTGSQAKLREVRVEQNSERVHYVQTIRELEEGRRVAKLEKQATENKVQNMSINYQQLQDKLKEEVAKSNKMFEELGAMKIQHQQMDVHLNQIREAEVTIAQLRSDLQGLQNQRTMENQMVVENTRLIQQLKHQLQTCQEDLEKKDIRIRELKDSEQRSDDMKTETARLSSELQMTIEELRRLKHENTQDRQLLQTGKAEHGKLLSEIKFLNNELVILKEEKATLKDENLRHRDDLLKIKNANKTLEDENGRLLNDKKRLQDVTTNGSIEDKAQVNQLTVELSVARSQLVQCEETHRRELDALRAAHQKDVEEHKNKNNELRQKNWKVMEALNAAESRCKKGSSSVTAATATTMTTASPSVNQQTETCPKNAFVQRLFANCKELESLPEDKCERLVTKFIDEFLHKEEKKADDSSEISKLKIQVSDYKKIIDETDGVLSSLQNDIKEAEIRWRKELKNKEEVIFRLKEQMQLHNSQNVSELENSVSDSCSINDTCEVQNHCMNGPAADLSLNDLSSEESSATSSIAELPVKKNKKKEQWNVRNNKTF